MEKLVDRPIFDLLWHHLFEKEITVIHGARQTGKTTLVKQLIEALYQEKHILKEQIYYFNLDLFADFEEIADQTEFLRFLSRKCEQFSFIYVFIDEAQRLEDTGRFLKGIYDSDLAIKIVITGSSSLLLSRKTSESLMGRKRIFTVHPFSWEEFLRRENPNLLSSISQTTLTVREKKSLIEKLFDYLRWGGYPKVATTKSVEDKKQNLLELYSSYIDKDVIQYLGVKNPFGFVKLLRLLSDQIGNLVNMTELASTCGMKQETVENYVHYMIETYIISLARPYSTNVRSEIVKMPKVFFLDSGYRNYVNQTLDLSSIEKEKGKLLENFVYTELQQKFDSVHFWRSKDKAEVDFVISVGKNNLIPIEVKALEFRAPVLSKSLHSFLKVYSCSHAYIVNLSLEATIVMENCTIHFILPWQLSLISASKDCHKEL
jgi:predicted AAA+ superfamily ATPase